MTCLQPAVAKRGRTLLYSLILQQNCKPHEPLAVTLATRCLFPGFLPLRLLPCAGLYRCRCRFFPWVAAKASGMIKTLHPGLTWCKEAYLSESDRRTPSQLGAEAEPTVVLCLAACSAAASLAILSARSWCVSASATGRRNYQVLARRAMTACTAQLIS